ncbi:hypothetical protein GCM10025795_43800 [Verticiella sediminum]
MNSIGVSGQYYKAFPSSPVDIWAINNPDAYVASIKADEFVDFLYPTAAPGERAALINAVQSGNISHVEMVQGWIEVAPHNPAPNADDVLEAVYDAGNGALPDADLAFDGVTAAQVDFLVSMYVGAFGRAPEFEGLAYWAGDVAHYLEEGMSEADAFRAVAKSMYHSGSVSGEAGTVLNNEQFLELAYASVLGRLPDASGRDHWLQELDTGVQSRDAFLFTFLVAALGADGDQSYLHARLAVASHAAQAHVSGPDAPGVDLVAILAGVADAGDAYRAILHLRAAYDEGAAGDLARFGGSLWQQDLLWEDTPWTLPSAAASGHPAAQAATAVEVALAGALPAYDDGS